MYGEWGYGNRWKGRNKNVVVKDGDDAQSLIDQGVALRDLPPGLTAGQILRARNFQEGKQQQKPGGVENIQKMRDFQERRESGGLGNAIAGPQGAHKGFYGGRPPDRPTVKYTSGRGKPFNVGTRKTTSHLSSGIDDIRKTADLAGVFLHQPVKYTPPKPTPEAMSNRLAYEATRPNSNVTSINPEVLKQVNNVRGFDEAVETARKVDLKMIRIEVEMNRALKELSSLYDLYGDEALALMTPGQLQLLDNRTVLELEPAGSEGGGGGGGNTWWPGGGGGGYGRSGGRYGSGRYGSSGAGRSGLINWRL